MWKIKFTESQNNLQNNSIEILLIHKSLYCDKSHYTMQIAPMNIVTRLKPNIYNQTCKPPIYHYLVCIDLTQITSL